MSQVTSWLGIRPTVRSGWLREGSEKRRRSHDPRIPSAWGTVTIQTASDGGSSSALAESIVESSEEQPYADDEGRIYRFLLKSTDADVLRRTAEVLTTK